MPIARPLVGAQEEEAVLAVLRSGQLAHGPVTEAFEQAFAAFVGTKHAVAVANGTAALQLALQAAGVGPGDEVVVPAFTFVATATAVLHAGATPVFADIDPATFTLDPDSAAAAITGRTRAILPVHLYGLPAHMDPLRDLAGDKELFLLEDCAQSHGATLGGASAGALGDAGCFSFYPTKNMTTGEGGMITTDDDALADAAASLRNHGRSRTELGTYDHVRMGYNLRTTDLQSAVGRVQLARLPDWTRRRQENAATLTEGLQDADGIEVPRVPEGRTHVFHQYTVRCRDRAAVQERLRAADVGFGVYYPKPLYEYPFLETFRTSCPEAERAAREVLSLPVHPALEPDDLATVVAAVCGVKAASAPRH